MDTNHNQAHILIVDDDERIRNLLQKFLLRNGFFVSVARMQHMQGVYYQV